MLYIMISILKSPKSNFWIYLESSINHIAFVVDFTSQSLIGKSECKIVWPKAMKLQCTPHTMDSYNHLLWGQIYWHELPVKLERLMDQTKYPASEELQREMKKIDVQTMEAMRYAESWCRSIKTGEAPSNPEYNLWEVGSMLLRYWYNQSKGKWRMWAT